MHDLEQWNKALGFPSYTQIPEIPSALSYKLVF